MGIAACLPRVPAHAAIVRRGEERRGVERRVAQRLGVHTYTAVLASDFVRRRQCAHGLGLTEGVHNTQCVLCFMVMSAQDAIGDDTAGNREYV